MNILKLNKIVSCLLALVLVCTFAMPASAVSAFILNSSDEAYLSEGITVVNTKVNDGESVGLLSKNKTDDTDLFIKLEASEQGNEYCFNAYMFEGLSSKVKKDTISAFVIYIKSSGMSLDGKQKLYNALKASDNSYVNIAITDMLDQSSANTVAATVWLQPIFGIIGLILGIGVITLMFLLVASVLVDMGYLASLYGHNKDGNKPWYITLDAFKAYQAAVEKDTNVYWNWFTRKIKTFIVFAFCTTLVIGGAIGDFLGNMLAWASGIFDLLNL